VILLEPGRNSKYPIHHENAFAKDKSITVDNLEKFSGKFDIKSTWRVTWVADKSKKDTAVYSALRTVRWNIQFTIETFTGRHKTAFKSAVITRDNCMPEDVYRSVMAEILDGLTKITTDAINNQIIEYEVED
jgi:hypothetical protein